MLAQLTASNELYRRQGAKTVAYLSAEFLLGPHLGNNILNLRLTEKVREAMSQLNLDLELILEAEEEPGLGNGDLGRLAACYMESLATLEIPATGYGIRYEYGSSSARCRAISRSSTRSTPAFSTTCGRGLRVIRRGWRACP